MKYEVTLKRKPTFNEVQNARQMRVEVFARDEEEAKYEALSLGNRWRYFTAESVRRV